ncbi:MAG: phosphoribosylanthranilate isomerase [Planktomarina sp.]|jgi:phosphoribosylanthranilate isomerase|nr:phosphoribosylanthranilate isomerase [Planktomarina sp.]MDG1745526.1 phosphoribosylanthranilate isomerase [Planktomarina sp.]
MKVRAKLCGLTTPDDIDAAAAAGAAYIGLVFFEKSPRNVAIETARSLAIHAPVGLAKVALVVNADDAALDRITDRVPLDMLQLHGSESPQRVAAVKARYGLPVMKALGIASRVDVARAQLYSGVADQLLLDAKPPEGEALPGGNGLSFDWRLLEGESWSVPWMLAGGLTPDNVAEAVRRSAARQVDVSSGIETAPGQKSAELMAKFVSEANR